MPSAIATPRPAPDTHTSDPVPEPGISTTEANLIATAARRFLDRTTPGFNEITMATITYQIGTLFAPYMRPFTEPYLCVKSQGEVKTHWCSIG